MLQYFFPTWGHVGYINKIKATTIFRTLITIFLNIALFGLHLYFSSPILCEAPNVGVKYFEVPETSDNYPPKPDLYQEKPDLFSPVINKMDGSFFTDKSPMRDFIHK